MSAIGTKLRAGDWIVVRSKEEILSTLDQHSRLAEMPFMPEMFQYCGQTFRVHRRAHKTCDPVNGLEGRRLANTVHLEDLRCDGAYHAGCQAGCLIFWKDAWLAPIEPPAGAAGSNGTFTSTTGGCTERDVLAGTLAVGQRPDEPSQTFVCQATQVRAATVPLRGWDLRQYVEDYSSGNASLARIASAFAFWLYHATTGLGLGFGSVMRWAYDVFQRLVGGTPYPWRLGKVPDGERTPTAKLDMQEGEFVTIKTYDEILETLDREWKNRGLYFDGEMVPYTGSTYRVLKRVTRIIDEKTGKMLNFKNAALILEDVVCQARYAKCRKLCPRGYYLYWREIWVERRNEAGRTPPKDADVMTRAAQ